jgi:hypothetical protein
MKLYQYVLLSVILALAPVCSQAQMLQVIVASGSSGGGGSSVALITSNCEALGANGGTTASFNATGGNFIVGGLIGYDTNPPVVVDDQGNTVTTLTREAFVGDTSIQLFYEQNPSSMGSGHTLSVSTTGSFAAICYTVFSGMKTSGVLDSGTTHSTHVSSGGCQPASTAPSSGNNVVISVVAGNGASWTINAGFTKLGNVANGSTYGGTLGYLINGGTVQPTWTPNAGNTACTNAVFLGA